MNKEDNKINIGQQLKYNREKSNIEIVEICNRLNVKMQDVTAIENEDWDFLKSKSYALNLIISYSRLLKIDEKLLTEEIKKLPINVDIKNSSHKLVNIGENLDLTPEKKDFVRFLTYSILLFIVFLVIFNINNIKKLNHQTLIEKSDKIIGNNKNESQSETDDYSAKPLGDF